MESRVHALKTRNGDECHSISARVRVSECGGRFRGRRGRIRIVKQPLVKRWAIGIVDELNRQIVALDIGRLDIGDDPLPEQAAREQKVPVQHHDRTPVI